MNKNINVEYVEQCIVKTFLENKNYGILITNKFIPEYFDSESASIIFNYYKKHLQEFNELPEKEILINSVGDKKESIKTYIEDIYSIDLDISKSYDWIYEQTNEYLKDKALKYSILKSIDIIDNKQDTQDIMEIRRIIEEALCKDLKIDLGLNYFGMLSERLKRIFYATDNKISSGFPSLDEITNGGFPPYTLNVFAAVTFGGKSLMMANIIARQILEGKNCVLFTMEMSEDMFAQRFDSIYSKLDVNRMYIQKKLQGKLVESLGKIKNKPNRGELYIKEFPTGKATVNDLRIYIRELKMRNVNVDVIFCDYINLMCPSNNTRKGSNSYEKIKDITRDLRALSLEMVAPVISVTQINREGSFLDLKELDFNYVADGISIAMDSDFVAVLGNDPDKLVYESEIHYKVVKNRLGGRAGTITKMFLDTRSLKLYDECEYDEWISDASTSGDERNIASKTP